MKLHIRCFALCASADEAKHVFTTLASRLEIDPSTPVRIERYWKLPDHWEINFSFQGDFNHILGAVVPRRQWTTVVMDGMIDPWAVWTFMDNTRFLPADPRVTWLLLEGFQAGAVVAS